MDSHRGLLPRQSEAMENRGGVVRRGATGGQLGAEDAEAAEEAGWHPPGVALGGEPAGVAPVRWEAVRDYQKAYGYLRQRISYMRYADYQRLGLPLGSGVTEAGCKTVYTQRLKLSGMRWKPSGAQTILDLRVLQLSGVWAAAYERVLHRWEEVQVPGQPYRFARKAQKAA